MWQQEGKLMLFFLKGSWGWKTCCTMLNKAMPFKPNTFFSTLNTEMSFLLSYFPGNHVIWSFHTPGFLFFLFFFWCCQRASSNLVLTSMKLSVIPPPRWLHSVQARPLRLLCCFSCCLQGHLWCLLTVLGAFWKVSSSTAVSAQSARLQFNSTVKSCRETTDSKIRGIQLTVANRTDCPQSVSGFHFLPFSCD